MPGLWRGQRSLGWPLCLCAGSTDSRCHDNGDYFAPALLLLLAAVLDHGGRPLYVLRLSANGHAVLMKDSTPLVPLDLDDLEARLDLNPDNIAMLVPRAIVRAALNEARAGREARATLEKVRALRDELDQYSEESIGHRALHEMLDAILGVGTSREEPDV